MAVSTEARAKENYAAVFSLVVGLSDNMQITFQSGYEADETDEQVNARIDRMVALATRQRGIAEAPALEAREMSLRLKAQ